MKKALTFLMVIALVMTLGFSANAEDRDVSGTLNLYTSMQLDLVEPLGEFFEEKYPDVNVDIMYSGAVELEQRLWSEHEAGEIQADVIWGADPSLALDFKEQGLAMQYESPYAENVPDFLKDEDNYYIAGRVYSMGFGYNDTLVSEEEVPSTWDEFLELGDRAAMASPLHSGTSFTALSAMVEDDRYGWEWFEEARDAGVDVLRGTGDVTRALSAGEYDVIKGIDYVMGVHRDEGAPLQYKAPEDGAVTVQSPMIIPEDADNPDVAKEFVDYMLSEEGQSFLAEEGYLTPVRADVDPPEGFPSADEIESLEIPYEVMAEEGEEIRDRFSEIYE